MGGKQRIGFVYQLRYFVASYLPVATCRDIIKNSKVGTARVGTKLHIFLYYIYFKLDEQRKFRCRHISAKTKKNGSNFRKKISKQIFWCQP